MWPLLLIACSTGPADPDRAPDGPDSGTDVPGADSGPQADTGDGRDSGEPAPSTVALRWFSAGSLLSWEQAQAGLWWSLSSLGALPADPDALQVQAVGDGVVDYTLDLSRVGFPDAALPAVDEALAAVSAAPDFAAQGAMDTGRFLMLTAYEPWRYYAITGACDALAGWQGAHRRAPTARYAVTDSLLVSGHRLIELNTSVEQATAIALSSAERTDLSDPDEEPHEHEVVDVMPNGRQRYAIYTADGALTPAADPAVSPAGQPGKCLWCHENALMFGQPNPELDGFWTYAQFTDEIALQQARLDAHRGALDTVVDFSTKEVHAWAELLVEEFLRPPPARVAAEWGATVAEVDALGLEASTNGEHPGLGPVLRRAEVDAAFAARAGWTPQPTLPSARELDPDAPLASATLGPCR